MQINRLRYFLSKEWKHRCLRIFLLPLYGFTATAYRLMVTSPIWALDSRRTKLWSYRAMECTPIWKTGNVPRSADVNSTIVGQLQLFGLGAKVWSNIYFLPLCWCYSYKVRWRRRRRSWSMCHYSSLFWFVFLKIRERVISPMSSI